MIDGTNVLRIIQFVTLANGVAFNFFLSKIEPIYWSSGHHCDGAESLLMGLFGGCLLANTFGLNRLASQSQALYKKALLFSAGAITLYLLASQVTTYMHASSLFFYVVLYLVYGFSTNNRNSSGVDNLTPFQRNLKNVWTGFATISAFLSLFLPAVAEQIYFANPTGTPYFRTIQFFLGLTQFQMVASVHSINDREALRNDFVLLSLSFAVQSYLLYPSLGTLTLKAFPILGLATAFAFHQTE